MNKEKSLEQFKKNINLMFENNDKEIYLNKDDALKIEYYIYSLEQQIKKQKEVINKAIEYIRIYRSYQKIDNKDYLKGRDEIGCLDIYQVDELLDILKEK